MLNDGGMDDGYIIDKARRRLTTMVLKSLSAIGGTTSDQHASLLIERMVWAGHGRDDGNWDAIDKDIEQGAYQLDY